MVAREDVVNVASGINFELQENEIDWLVDNYPQYENENDPWYITLEDMMYQLRSQEEEPKR